MPAYSGFSIGWHVGSFQVFQCGIVFVILVSTMLSEPFGDNSAPDYGSVKDGSLARRKVRIKSPWEKTFRRRTRLLNVKRSDNTSCFGNSMIPFAFFFLLLC